MIRISVIPERPPVAAADRSRSRRRTHRQDKKRTGDKRQGAEKKREHSKGSVVVIHQQKDVSERCRTTRIAKANLVLVLCADVSSL